MTRIATFRLSATRQLKQYRIRVVDERDTRPTSKRPPLFGQTDLVLRKSMNMSSSRRGLLRLIDVAGFHAGLRFTRAATLTARSVQLTSRSQWRSVPMLTHHAKARLGYCCRALCKAPTSKQSHWLSRRSPADRGCGDLHAGMDSGRRQCMHCPRSKHLRTIFNKHTLRSTSFHTSPRSCLPDAQVRKCSRDQTGINRKEAASFRAEQPD